MLRPLVAHSLRSQKKMNKLKVIFTYLGLALFGLAVAKSIAPSEEGAIRVLLSALCIGGTVAIYQSLVENQKIE